MAVGNVYQITTRGQYLSQEFVMRFHYRQSQGTPSDDNATLLYNVFMSTCYAGVRAIMLESAVTDQVQVVNIQNPVDYSEASINVAGLFSDLGGLSPSWMCITFRTIRERPGLRYGYKRPPGLPKNAYIGNGIDPARNDQIVQVLAGLNATLSSGGNVWVPFVATGRIVLGQVLTTGYDISGWIVNGLGTQNSRKPGRGD